MANRSLLPVYKMLYGRNFHYVNFDQRLEMQITIEQRKNPETVEISGFSVMRDQFRYTLKIGKIES